jgi:hypothetical protein
VGVEVAHSTAEAVGCNGLDIDYMQRAVVLIVGGDSVIGFASVVHFGQAWPNTTSIALIVCSDCADVWGNGLLLSIAWA